MNIGQVAKATRLTAKMIRHYESLGLFSSSTRTEAGYRVFSESDLQVLHFIRRARRMGFSLPQVQQLITLRNAPQRLSRDVHALVESKLQEVETAIRELELLREELRTSLRSCPGNDDPDCPILERLENDLQPACHGRKS